MNASFRQVFDEYAVCLAMRPLPIPEFRAIGPTPRQALRDQHVADVDAIDGDRRQRPTIAIDTRGRDPDRSPRNPVIQKLDKAIRRPVRQRDLGRAAADVRVGFRRVEALQPDPLALEPDGIAVDHAGRIALRAAFFDGMCADRNRCQG